MTSGSGGPRKGTSAHADSQAHSSPRGQLTSPQLAFLLHLSGLLGAHEAAVPFGEGWDTRLKEAMELPPY